MSAVSYQVFFNKSCKPLNGCASRPMPRAFASASRSARAAILRRAAGRRDRQRQQQLFLGQLAQRYQTAVGAQNSRSESAARRLIAANSISLPPLTGNANPCRQRWHISCGAARTATRAPRGPRPASKCEARTHDASGSARTPAAGATRQLIDAFEHRGVLGQARAIDEVWQAGCHGPRIIGPVPTSVKNESGASRCF